MHPTVDAAHVAVDERTPVVAVNVEALAVLVRDLPAVPWILLGSFLGWVIACDRRTRRLAELIRAVRVTNRKETVAQDRTAPEEESDE